MNTNKNTGLNNKEVLESRKKHGSNTISIKNRNTFFRIVIESLNDPIIKILLIALAIKVPPLIFSEPASKIFPLTNHGDFERLFLENALSDPLFLFQKMFQKMKIFVD